MLRIGDVRAHYCSIYHIALRYAIEYIILYDFMSCGICGIKFYYRALDGVVSMKVESYHIFVLLYENLLYNMMLCRFHHQNQQTETVETGTEYSSLSR